MYLGLEHRAFRIHEQVPLVAADLLLAAIVTPHLATGSARIGRLRVDDALTSKPLYFYVICW